MNASMERRPASALAVFLAGLQAGMIAVLWMLAWLGVSAMWQRRSFWSAVNLMASVLAGNGAIRSGFASSTWSGLALYVLIYSLLGAAFAVLVRNRFTGLGTLLLGVFFSVGWYYLWFRWLGQTLMPLVWLLHAERATVFAHVIFGALMTRFPLFVEGGQGAATPDAEPAVAEAAGVSTQPDTELL
ncbi:MAG: hypothetical protein JWP63_3214 [Candidatus Solibacter sp.]|nr:hypothetical protein [Candidatus Solibacter sp.]